MPFGDLTVSEGKLVRWLKKPGDPVAFRVMRSLPVPPLLSETETLTV